jgi:hypothetical protein
MNPTRQPTRESVNDPVLTPPVLLRGAALYLFLHGWNKGGFFDFASGKPFPPACALGAINISAYGRAILGSDDDADDANTDAAIKAMRVFAAHIDPEYDVNVTSAIDVVGDWNDDQSRTVGEVILMLTDAACDWEAAHPSGGAR